MYNMQLRSSVLIGVATQCKYVNLNYNIARLTANQAQLSKRSYALRAYYHQPGTRPLRYGTLGQHLQETAAKFSERTALISCHENKCYTYAEVTCEAEKLAAQLKKLGMRGGDIVGLWSTNNALWYVSFLAAQLAGLTVACINPALQPQELAYALQKAKVKMLITKTECGLYKFQEVLKELLPNAAASGTINSDQFPHLRHIVLDSEASLSTTPCAYTNWRELLAAPSAETTQVLQQLSPESACCIQFTSGTTGLPKVALLSNFAFSNQAYFFGQALGLEAGGAKRICLPLPLFHVFGLSVMNAAIEHGATLVLPSARFNSAAVLESISKEGCHIIFGTPTMYVDMLVQLKHQQSLNKISLDTLRLGAVGGAACSPELHTQVKQLFGLSEFRIGYGMSETCGAYFVQTGTESADEAVTTVGRLFEHIEVKVIDNQGEAVRFGEQGELCVRGYLVMTEYLDDVMKTKEVLDKHGWLKTGDKFILESNGVGRIVGRIKDVIIRGGENIFPKEIEDHLDTHEDIVEAQIIGVPDDRLGEEICAYIRLRPDANQLTLENVKDFCKGKIAHFKVPRYIRFVKEYPKTTSGKIKKYELLEWFKKETVN
ncbi:acyl-CoA synthetase family member 2, mitochondrial [Ceratitis capitata]|uniref:Medium-chain acyl-CoA ligase ACSF2, mitochondrial n=1 Tax=Ceratitis capitata TaxID=7213 RepID=A0A811UPG0_CERCA|nr:acyl-CoA synthetase family member 2, mitochondrial [Ceratitis capitata]CAD7000634.1 unnamed protein product [Ceratitis capitata]